MAIQDHHKSPFTKNWEKCKANIACPYGTAGNVTTPSGIPVKKGQTFNQARRQYQKQQLAKAGLAAKQAAEQHILTEAEIVDRMYSLDEKAKYYANVTLCNYDNARGHDNDINTMLCQLKDSHPEDFIRLSKGFNSLGSVAEKKKAIKDCYKFYQNNPIGVYKNFPRLSDEDLNLMSKDGSKYEDLFYYADRSGDLTLQGKLEYISHHHPRKVDNILANRGDFASDEEFEEYLNETYDILVKIDEQNRKKISEKAKSGRFIRRANAFVTFFRKLAVVRKFDSDSKLAQTNHRETVFDGDLFGGGWLLYGKKLYRKVVPSEEETEKNLEKARQYL